MCPDYRCSYPPFFIFVFLIFLVQEIFLVRCRSCDRYESCDLNGTYHRWQHLLNVSAFGLFPVFGRTNTRKQNTSFFVFFWLLHSFLVFICRIVPLQIVGISFDPTKHFLFQAEVIPWQCFVLASMSFFLWSFVYSFTLGLFLGCLFVFAVFVTSLFLTVAVLFGCTGMLFLPAKPERNIWLCFSCWTIRDRKRLFLFVSYPSKQRKKCRPSLESGTKHFR